MSRRIPATPGRLLEGLWIFGLLLGLFGPAAAQPPTAGSSGGNGSNANGDVPAAGFGAAGARGASPQVQRQYDIRGYTGYTTRLPAPEQAIVQWVLRETGTEVWFGAPYGYLWANRDALQVYHTPEVQDVVARIVDRFVAGPKEPQVFTVGIVKVGSPDWRTQAMQLLQPVDAQSPGVQAWLVSKENVAVLQQQFQQRADYKPLRVQDLVLYNGQSEKLSATRSRNYVRGVRPNSAGWPPFQPEIEEIKEGYEIELSPLLEVDGSMMDLVLRCHIDQVERLVPVDVNVSVGAGQTQTQRIEVPQLVSYRMHERFRWRADQVLLLSAGVVATPDESANPANFFHLDRWAGGTPGRADALLWIQYKGRGTVDQLGPGTPVAASPESNISRGRY